MAKVRKAVAYRALERPYTRYSKYKNQNFVRGNPHVKIVRFTSGNPKKEFPAKIVLISSNSLQIRDIAIESARLACGRSLEKSIGKENFHMKFLIYPHHILRENPLASGAGADRMSTGMKKSFGKPIGKAAQVKAGKELVVVRTETKNISAAKKALRYAAHKFPTSCTVKVLE
ncbi:50S ribosomal protein L16 [Candidatus Woesearchaeota archaeon]|nr:50S ribosomal protein L16 [Candidatus Woesearchaeota archaeon]MBW3018552.1 50S ribosomal protein L16 [Candidatus Woesearchaeota archaeon]